jgi:hypothetical protein
VFRIVPGTRFLESYFMLETGDDEITCQKCPVEMTGYHVAPHDMPGFTMAFYREINGHHGDFT